MTIIPATKAIWLIPHDGSARRPVVGAFVSESGSTLPIVFGPNNLCVGDAVLFEDADAVVDIETGQTFPDMELLQAAFEDRENNGEPLKAPSAPSAKPAAPAVPRSTGKKSDLPVDFVMPTHVNFSGKEYERQSFWLVQGVCLFILTPGIPAPMNADKITRAEFTSLKKSLPVVPVDDLLAAGNEPAGEVEEEPQPEAEDDDDIAGMV